MNLEEIKLEETVICHNCRKVYKTKGWEATQILKEKCPNCGNKTLYWAVKEKEETKWN